MVRGRRVRLLQSGAVRGHSSGGRRRRVSLVEAFEHLAFEEDRREGLDRRIADGG
jgi:hypothetical protein